MTASGPAPSFNSPITVCVYETEPEASLGGDDVCTIVKGDGRPPDPMTMFIAGRRGVRRVYVDPRVRLNAGEAWWQTWIEPMIGPQTEVHRLPHDRVMARDVLTNSEARTRCRAVLVDVMGSARYEYDATFITKALDEHFPYTKGA